MGPPPRSWRRLRPRGAMRRGKPRTLLVIRRARLVEDVLGQPIQIEFADGMGDLVRRVLQQRPQVRVFAKPATSAAGCGNRPASRPVNCAAPRRCELRAAVGGSHGSESRDERGTVPSSLGLLHQPGDVGEVAGVAGDEALTVGQGDGGDQRIKITRGASDLQEVSLALRNRSAAAALSSSMIIWESSSSTLARSPAAPEECSPTRNSASQILVVQTASPLSTNDR